MVKISNSFITEKPLVVGNLVSLLLMCPRNSFNLLHVKKFNYHQLLFWETLIKIFRRNQTFPVLHNFIKILKIISLIEFNLPNRTVLIHALN